MSVTFSNPEVGDLTISGTINTQTLDNALSTISLLSQHEFKLNGDQCTIL
ncbi:MAG: FecR domain-containing protein [Fidelibacterota bacterium]